MNMRRLTVLLMAAGLLALLIAPALAADRVALVIGNAQYAHAPRLANPLIDAADIGAALNRLGFAVTKLENANFTALRQALLALTRASSAADIAVVFYAGHGIEVDQRNFLVPVDAKLASDQDVEFETVPLELVMRSVGRAGGLRLVILDACRENPFAVLMQRAGATRSVGRGLARVEPAGETLVAYAAKEGTVAADGEGRNSPYSAALLAHLEEPGLEVGLLFRKVRDAVLASTGGRQEPFVYGSLSSRGVYLTPAWASAESEPSTAVSPPVSATVSDRLTAEELAVERLFWESVKDSTNLSDFQAYLSRYPQGKFTLLARNRLEALRRPDPSPQSSETVEAGLELSRADRRLIQLGLAAKGFDPGPADGLFGRGTRGAIGRWQASRGEAVTGHLGVESAKVLLAAGEQAAAREQARRDAEERARLEAAEAERRQHEREAQARARREVETRQEWERLGLVMVRVEGGRFTMGCQSGRDAGLEQVFLYRLCAGNEKPAHWVQVGSFEIGKYEVTQALWAAVMGANPSKFKGCDECPVENVSWIDVQRFLANLNARTKGGYRLPTEAEWEYAARGGRRSRGYVYAGGNDPVSVAWYGGISGRRTHPVGQKRANELGLYDMSGNVMEWTQDCWHGGYQGAPGDGRAWERGDCNFRMARGGTWQRGVGFLRAASRTQMPPRLVAASLGVRIARTFTP